MPKGARTRHTILREAVDLASVVGLQGLTIGSLATHTGLSKSGLFAHFGSKQHLQLATLEAVTERFREVVIRPALTRPRGLARIRALFENWLNWNDQAGPRGGCLFAQAAAELDDQPGPAREYVASAQRQWLEFLAGAARRAIATGEFRRTLDCVQFTHDLNAIYLGFHQARRLLRDPLARTRARRAFHRLLEDARTP